MEIKKTTKDKEMTIVLEGRLDTYSAPQLEAELGAKLDNVEALTIDLEKLQYISSAGLRVLLGAQKKMNAQKGRMIVEHVNELVMEVFEVTGFLDILTIK